MRHETSSDEAKTDKLFFQKLVLMQKHGCKLTIRSLSPALIDSVFFSVFIQQRFPFDDVISHLNVD